MMEKENREQVLMSGAIGLFGLPDTPALQRAASETLDFMETVWRLEVDPNAWPATMWYPRPDDGNRD